MKVVGLNKVFLSRRAGFRMLRYRVPEVWVLAGLLVLLFGVGERVVGLADPSAGLPLKLTWLFVLQGVIVFFGALALCWWLLQRAWFVLGLPAVSSLVVYFEDLELWQKLGFYFASFALLVLALVGCLIAIC